MNTSNYFFATCSKGVEDLLQTELEQLAIPNIKIHTGGVAFHGDFEHAYKACLWSRVASRILYQLKEFKVSNDDELYQEIIDVDWMEHFSEINTLAIDCFSSHSEITNSHFATLRVKDAIVDQFMRLKDERPSISKVDPDIRLNVYLSDKQCLLYLDFSGEALHKRGYRQGVGSAPIRETLAAAMLYRARWHEFYTQGLPLNDPMCGSGTLLIEAAMMAGDIAPGLLRENFGFSHWKLFDQALWESIRNDAVDKKSKAMSSIPIICGSDSDEIIVGIARKNIVEAGLESVIKVSLQDATQDLKPCSDIATSGKKGLLITNPPYGKRIGSVELLRTLYYRFGAQLKSNFFGWTAVLITSEKVLAQSLGMRTFRKNTLFNGALISILYQYRIDSSPTKKVDDSSDTTTLSNEVEVVASKKSEHSVMFANRLKKNYKHLKKWARKNNTTCYRVYDADIPQYAVAIDKYDNWIHVQEYKAPKTIDKNKAFLRINDVIDVVADILETDEQCVVLKVRKKQEGSSQYQKQDKKDRKLTVEENGHMFLINMHDYIDTGLFLDHRNTRLLIEKMASKRTFLNLFAYTGSVTVYAAAGGAETTTTVDMSNTYLGWAEENLALNGFKEDAYKNSKHDFIRADCLEWMKAAIAENQQYQLIFVDPPTFSNSKKMTTSLDVNRDHMALLSGCLALLTDDGQIVFSTNAKGFKLDEELKQDCFIKEITSITTTEDYRRKPQHRSWLLAKMESALETPF